MSYDFIKIISSATKLRWPTSTRRKSSWFFTFVCPKNRKANFKSNWPVQPKRLFSVLLHRHDMSDRNLGFRWRQQSVFFRKTSLLKKYRRSFLFYQSYDVYTFKCKEVFNLKQKSAECIHHQCGLQMHRDEKIYVKM